VVGEGLEGGVGQRVDRVRDRSTRRRTACPGRPRSWSTSKPTAGAGLVRRASRAPPNEARRMPRGTAGRRACPAQRPRCRAAPARRRSRWRRDVDRPRTSTRLMKKLATLATRERSASGSAASRSSPRRYASMTFEYRSRLKINVTLMHRPSAIICSIGAEPLLGAGDLDHEVATVDPLVEAPCGRFGARTVVSEARSDLDADVPVDAVGVVVDLREHVAGAVDVSDHDRPVRIIDRAACGAEVGELLVVVARVLDRLLEDRRIRREAAHTTVSDLDEPARGDVAALEIVEPGALALFVVECDDPVVCHGVLSGWVGCASTSTVAQSSSAVARSTT
jgi:hypothetical protein